MPSESPSNREKWSGPERRAGTFRPLPAFALLTGMAIILIVGWLSYRTTSTLIDNSSWINHTQEVINNLDELLYSM